MEFNHETVLLTETVDHLAIKPDGQYVDCTLGGAGHAEYLLGQLNEAGHLYAFDQDITAIHHAKEKLSTYVQRGMVTFIHQNFRYLKEALAQVGVEAVDGVIYDLGVSSPQFDEASRGFSYRFDARLDMRMDQGQALTAYEIVNHWPYEDLVRIFFRYGEEKFSKQVARRIESSRQDREIETTFDLVDLIKEAIPAPARRKGGHPAKRIFQALRIAVNDELGACEESLEQAMTLLKPEGRISAISFHSLEDRLVKVLFKQASTPPQVPHNLPLLPEEVKADYYLVNRKPIIASPKELAHNPRAKSAKLRVLARR